jgi:DNA-binding MarR family transcriptional regulator
LKQTADSEDGRIKWFSISPLGLETVEASSAALRKDILEAFSVWSADEIAQAHDLLFRLKTHMDDNRH